MVLCACWLLDVLLYEDSGKTSSVVLMNVFTVLLVSPFSSSIILLFLPFFVGLLIWGFLIWKRICVLCFLVDWRLFLISWLLFSRCWWSHKIKLVRLIVLFDDKSVDQIVLEDSDLLACFDFGCFHFLILLSTSLLFLSWFYSRWKLLTAISVFFLRRSDIWVFQVEPCWSLLICTGKFSSHVSQSIWSKQSVCCTRVVHDQTAYNSYIEMVHLA